MIKLKSIALRFVVCFLLQIVCVLGFAQEVCTNGIDDDGDGLVDLNDSDDCFCGGITSGGVSNLIANPSFEEYISCPMGEAEIFNLTGDWFQATNGTSDFFHSCGFTMGMVPLPLPDGNGYTGAYVSNYQGEDRFEYIGTCLTDAMEAGVTYELQFNISTIEISSLELPIAPNLPPIDITIFGFGSCGTAPLPTWGCPETAGWNAMGSVTYNPEDVWSDQTISFTPTENINAIILGAPCNLNGSYASLDGDGYDLPYFYYDNLILRDPLSNIVISQSGGNCLDDLILSVEESDVLTYQWYFEGVAIAEETSFSLNLGQAGYDAGVYQVMVTSSENGTCAILETEVIIVNQNNPVDFTADIISGCYPLDVNFTNLTNPALIESVVWSFGLGNSTEINPGFTFDEPGLYSVTLTVVSPDGCVNSITLEDYIEVFDNSSTEITYSILEECNPFIVLFQSDAPPGSTVNWDFGALGTSADFEPIQAYNQTGVYEVQIEVMDVNTSCLSTGTVQVDISIANPPEFLLDAPDFICLESTEKINAVYEDGSIYWLKGETGSTLEINNPGLYRAIFTRNDGCEAIDSVFVPLKELPKITSINNIEACIGNAVQLFADADSPVYWDKLSNNNVAMVYTEGTYKAIAENECGLEFIEVEVIFHDCSCQIYIPNAFSPNGDGINDLFKPAISCELSFYELRIFNRWGNEVFFTNDAQKSWNGTSKNNPDFFIESSMYNYIVVYDNGLQQKNDRQIAKGFIQLIR